MLWQNLLCNPYGQKGAHFALMECCISSLGILRVCLIGTNSEYGRLGRFGID